MLEANKRNIRTLGRAGERGAICGYALPELVSERDDIYVLTADLALLSALGQVAKVNPSRLINTGIAEQNMIGAAAGLALEGNTVFATTYATFISMRPYEQIRHCLGYHKANVKIIGATAGISMGMSGNTHYALEDIAIMRCIPNIMVLSPSDAIEAYQLAYIMADMDTPAYIRLTGLTEIPSCHEEGYQMQIGKADYIRKGSDTALVSTGTMVYECMEAAEILSEKGISAAVINEHTLKPFDNESLEFCRNFRHIFTVEEHSVIGGLGDACASYMAQNGFNTVLHKIGINDSFLLPAEYEYMKNKYNLTGEAIAETCINIFNDV